MNCPHGGSPLAAGIGKGERLGHTMVGMRRAREVRWSAAQIWNPRLSLVAAIFPVAGYSVRTSYLWYKGLDENDTVTLSLSDFEIVSMALTAVFLCLLYVSDFCAGWRLGSCGGRADQTAALPLPACARLL